MWARAGRRVVEADVAVVGGGLVGAAVARALQALPLTARLRVAVVDPAAAPLPPPGEAAPAAPEVPDARVSTLTPASEGFLRRLGAWEAVAPGAAAFGAMQVWDTPGRGVVRYEARAVGAAALGHVAENARVQAALLAALRAGPEVELVRGAVRTLAYPGQEPAAAAAEAPAPHRAVLGLEDGTEVRAKLVVGADGARSEVRRLAGIRSAGWGYGQRAVVATVATAPADRAHGTAWQRFLPTGPLALLPVRDGFSNVVWSTTPAEARRLEGAGPRGFAEAVNAALRGREGRGGRASSAAGPGPWRLLSRGGDRFVEPPECEAVAGPAPPRSFPLQLNHALTYVRPRVVLVGDAAHSVHPLAGQGVNLGFADAECLARTLAEAMEVGGEIGSPEVLGRYEAERRAENLGMAAALDGLKRVFAWQSAPLALARNLGLAAVNGAGPVKDLIMRYAMGSGSLRA